mgnify:CR=1 FL=1
MRSDITNISHDIHVVEGALRNSLSLPKVYVYVEDDTDIIFWRSILRKYEDKYSFDISTYTIPDIEKNKRELSQREFRGKDFMMKDVNDNRISLGKQKIICIDADYDLIIDKYHKYTKKLRNNDYIISTYGHSVENFRCAPQNIRYFYELLTLTSVSNINFCKLLEDVSILVYPLLQRLLISLYLKSNDYNICNCSNDIKKLHFDKLGITSRSKTNIKHEIATHADYLAKHAKIWNKIETALSSLGFNQNNCYLMIQGHCLEEHVVIPMLKYYVEMERKNKEILIKHNYDNNDFREARLQLYRKETGSYKDLTEQIQRMIFECSSIPLDIHITQQIYKKLDGIYA